MPIYVYKCSACGHTQDVLQKMSDPRLTVCPSCGKSTYEKQVTAAGFRLKGTGWYVTDFRNIGSDGHDSHNGDTSNGAHHHANGGASTHHADAGAAVSTASADKSPAPAAVSAAAVKTKGAGSTESSHAK
ncbi:MAG: zinc ribbon domain-containing protein [Candidimonas sp.]|nr:MAG: zinc ribbon domain-containing protein [Candidimonas sp.]